MSRVQHKSITMRSGGYAIRAGTLRIEAFSKNTEVVLHDTLHSTMFDRDRIIPRSFLYTSTSQVTFFFLFRFKPLAGHPLTSLLPLFL